MIRRIISLVVLLLAANAGVRVSLVYFHAEQFKDAVKEVALFGAGKSDDVLRAKVVEAADANQIPLDPDFVDIKRASIVGSGDHVIIKYAYALMVPVLPGYQHRFEFDFTTP
jgi:hypothetical protein